MRNHADELLTSIQPDRALSLALGSQERLVMEIIIQPVQMPQIRSVGAGHPTVFPVPGSTGDDLENATWEDAEWR
jgi:hypothetical protein